MQALCTPHLTALPYLMSSSPKRAKAAGPCSQMDLLADCVAGMLAHMARSPVAAMSTEIRELCRVSIFDGISAAARAELLQLADACGPELQRCIGCMQGMAVADSLGHLWEFQVRAAVAVGGTVWAAPWVGIQCASRGNGRGWGW